MRYNSTISSARIFKLTLFVTLTVLMMFEIAEADVCAWRDPERTMQKMFPRAQDYKTITIKMTADKITAIEKQLGSKLDDSEKIEFNFYDITRVAGGKAQKLGTILALAGKGEHGAIEVVIGIDNAEKIVGAYIQRSRERVTKALQSAEFLGQFVGKTKDSPLSLGEDLKPASPEALNASATVAFVIKKMLVFYDVLKKGG